MVSPLIDENVMLEALKPGEPNASKLRAGATLLILDAFDRKVTRDQFIAALGAAIGLTDIVGKFEAMGSVKAFDMQNGRVTRADIEVTLASMTSQVVMYTEQCTKMATLLQQCPVNEDKVH